MEHFNYFADDIFETNSSNNTVENENFVAKVCDEGWYFKDDVSGVDEINVKVQILLSRGNILYHKGQWKEAAAVFQECFETVNPSTKVVVRMVQESLARCYLHLGDFKSSKEWALEMLKSSLTIDHHQVVHNLLSSICKKFGDCEGEKYHLQQFVTRQPLSPSHWFRLGQIYTECFKCQSSQNLSLSKKFQKLQVENKSEICSNYTEGEFLLKQNKESLNQCDRVTNNVGTHTILKENGTNHGGNLVNAINGSLQVMKGSVSSDEVTSIGGNGDVSQTVQHSLQNGSDCCCSRRNKFLWTDYAAVCFLRAKLLLKPLMTQELIFLKAKNQALVEEIEQRLADLKHDLDILQQLQMLCWQNLSIPDSITQPSPKIDTHCERKEHDKGVLDDETKRKNVSDFERIWILSILEQVHGGIR